MTKIESFIQTTLKETDGELIMVFVDKDVFMKKVGADKLQESIKKTVEFSNKNKESSIVYKNSIVKLIDIKETGFSPVEIEKAIGVDEYPSILIIEKNKVQNYLPYIIFESK
jgi:predicted transcriptional regulator